MTGRKIGKFGLGALIAGVLLLGAQPALAGPEQRAMAKRIHDRLTGVNATNAAIDDMEQLLLGNDVGPYSGDTSGKTAAEYAIDTTQNPNARYFYNVTLKNFVTPWTNEAQTVFAPLNDYTATAVGLIRDGADFRRILYDDVVYRGANGLGLSPYNNQDNDHYEELEALGPFTGDLSDDTILVEDAQSVLYPAAANPIPNFDSNAAAGVMTSRAGAMAFFSGGTNRAMFRFTLMNHLCTDLEPLKDTSRIPDRVRRDVSRSPGGDSRLFLNGCVACHAGMDGMAGAYAYYEWNYTNDDINTGILEYTPGAVSEKHNINPNNFADGYVTIDDSWINYWRNGPNAKLGVRPPPHPDMGLGSGWGHPGEVLDGKNNAIGNGARSLGIELANSKAFAQCQVDKVFEAVCLRDPNVHSTDRTARDGFVTNFKASGYNLRETFTDVAAYCKEARP